MTVSDFKAEHALLRSYSVEQIGRALDKAGRGTVQKRREPVGSMRNRSVLQVAMRDVRRTSTRSARP